MNSEKPLIQLTIDGHQVTVPKGTTVYHACRELGLDIPIFCYQDRMPPFGACRVCLVEVEKMGKLQTSCTLEATDGMVVKTQSDGAVKGRQEILEFLLINHPLDCPICDKGGECPLQDQALKFGPGQSHFFEEKRHFTKALPLGPVLMLDRERCIVCARCTRFGDIVAGDHALEFIDRGYKTEVGTPGGGPVESKFIGNTIQICPVGALTSQVYRFRARPWDHDTVPSTCTLCPVGCSMHLDSRDGEIVRTRSCENKALNDIWLCDKGWFGYEFVSSPERLAKPLIRRNGELVEATLDEALTLIASNIEKFKPSGKLAGFGGNPLTTEENYLFQKLVRTVLGVNHVDHRIGMPMFSLSEEGIPPGMEIEIGECAELSVIYLLGLDLTEEFPVIWLKIKEALNKGAKVVFLGHYAPEFFAQLSQVHVHRPGDEIESLRKHLSNLSSNNGALFVGSQYLASSNRIAILSELLKLKGNFSLNLLEGRGNSLGARVAGMRPDLGPLNKPLDQKGLDALSVLKEASTTGWDFLYIVGANVAEKFPQALWEEARKKTAFVVVQDLFLTETASVADVVLPSLCYVEKEGTFINIERRIQKLLPGKQIPDFIYSDAQIFVSLAEKLGVSLSVDDYFLRLFSLNKLPRVLPMTLDGQPSVGQAEGELKGSFAHALFDEGVRMKHNKHARHLAKEPHLRLHPSEGEKRGFKNDQTVLVKRDKASLKIKVKFDEGVALGTVVLPLGFDSFRAAELGPNLLNGLSVELETLR